MANGDYVPGPPARPCPLTPYTTRNRFQYRPIVCVSEDGYWREDTGDDGTDYGDLLSAPSSLIVVDSSAVWAGMTDYLGTVNPAFDYSVRQFETACLGVPDDAGGDFTYVEEICYEWGLRPKLQPYGEGKHHWHMVLDPSILVGESNLIQFLENNDYYRLASEFREWCRKRRIPISLTKGSAAARILRGLITEPQSKVPYATNTNCRRALGANMLRADTHGRTHIDVTEFDQKAAQHLVARDTPLPDRNDFYAHGDFSDLSEVMYLPGSEMFHLFTTQMERGVLYATVEPWVERAYRKQYPWSPYMPWTGEPIWLTTNELSLVKRCGLVLTGVIAAWTSDYRSYELKQHAKTSLLELSTASEFTRAWLKPANLAVYGATAANALPAIRRTYRGHDTRRNQSERITNHVAWLAMIQREVRKRSVMFAMDLEEIGVRVIGIYVDAVFAKVGNHDISGYTPIYFVEKAHGIFSGKNGVKIFGDTVTFPGMPLDDPERAEKARVYCGL